MSDPVLCIVDLFLTVNNATDRGVVQAHRTADLRQAVTLVQMRIADGLIALRFIGSDRGAKELR